MKIAIIGAGSGYMPGVIRGLLHRADDLAGAELAFHDVDTAHLDVMTRLARGMFSARGAAFTVESHTGLKPALDGASYVFTTFRPGGLAARHLDESIPLKHGVVGQETAGPGGFLMALRSVPVLLEIASAADPGAWIVNYTNPTNIVTDAVARATGARIIGLCDQFIGDTEMWADLLGLPSEGLEADWIGLNHATWARRLRLDGRELDVPLLLDGLEVPGGGATPWRDPSRMAELAKALGFLPNSYSKYYFFHDEVVGELRAKGTTRAQDILAMLPGYYEQVAAESRKADPDPSRERGGGEHGEFAVDVICALHRDEGRRMIVNTRNGGAVSSLDADAIVEVPSLVGRSGPVPLTMGALPGPVRGLTQAIHAYERLASDAAVTGDRRTALQALMAHPFVRSKHTAERILDEGLAAHRAHLPQFG
ncbi:family 4 glycosyl hydrolase [Actinomadura madurae]|uniref:family 4 glycosyl hydrolase n=2 Tax=Actinomadura madurae TaxID=1993 RepID=UPI00202752EC|nr:glycoside hydrolase family 4 [Actinomadura madurae]MCP9970443.1 glycoside hydrolase family 4 [Actinomadura madurae]MCP9982925.1 glycoside hydrolase family 4 [Actinomadura madurae]MCQ0019157.1 glycoside hydrolase family 4 [Actinomadura madurae]URM99174.1 glycoside hydrolase family 4 [Actinomadura madurae]URN09856.1 glycoside hydrolase family 4 [Actinomadura madurae]